MGKLRIRRRATNDPEVVDHFSCRPNMREPTAKGKTFLREIVNRVILGEDIEDVAHWVEDRQRAAIAIERESDREKIRRLSEQLIKCHMAEKNKLMVQGAAIEKLLNEIGISFDSLYRIIDEATAAIRREENESSDERLTDD